MARDILEANVESDGAMNTLWSISNLLLPLQTPMTCHPITVK
jgi:hypothetical protein